MKISPSSFRDFFVSPEAKRSRNVLLINGTNEWTLDPMLAYIDHQVPDRRGLLERAADNDVGQVHYSQWVVLQVRVTNRFLFFGRQFTLEKMDDIMISNEALAFQVSPGCIGNCYSLESLKAALTMVAKSVNVRINHEPEAVLQGITQSTTAFAYDLSAVHIAAAVVSMKTTAQIYPENF